MFRLLLNEHHSMLNHCWWVWMFTEQWQKSHKCLCRNFIIQEGWVVCRPEQTVKKKTNQKDINKYSKKTIVNWNWSVSVSVFIQFLNRVLNRLSFPENCIRLWDIYYKENHEACSHLAKRTIDDMFTREPWEVFPIHPSLKMVSLAPTKNNRELASQHLRPINDLK